MTNALTNISCLEGYMVWLLGLTAGLGIRNELVFFVQNSAAVKTRLNLGSPGCSFGWSGVTMMPTMAYYMYRKSLFIAP